jgi:hypothetical protein
MIQRNAYAIKNLTPTFSGASVAPTLAHVGQVSSPRVDHKKLRRMEMLSLRVDFFLLFCE